MNKPELDQSPKEFRHIFAPPNFRQFILSVLCFVVVLLEAYFILFKFGLGVGEVLLGWVWTLTLFFYLHLFCETQFEWRRKEFKFGFWGWLFFSVAGTMGAGFYALAEWARMPGFEV
ncbi:MAG: hypothetical protein P8P99_09185 [Maricaulis sp.]|nr:hypothetical protein [Maricaulis sp.]